jgi:hypothetical protein
MLTKYQRMEANIERIVYLEYDQLNLRLANQEIDLATYEEEAQLIEDWARDMYNDMDEV